jgi:hypothetical protein
MEIRRLRQRLDGASAMLDSSDSSSESSDDDCGTRSAAALCTRQAPAAPAASGTVSSSDIMMVSGAAGVLELAVPQPEEGWAWSEDEFRAAKFEGNGGRVLVCTGGK